MNRKLPLIISIFIILLSLPTLAFTTTLQIANIDNLGDSTVKQQFAFTNYGSSNTLEVATQTSLNKRVFVKFNLSALYQLNISEINSATIYLYEVTSGGTSRNIAVSNTTEFNENTITWNNQPSADTLQDTTNCVSGDAWRTWNIANALNYSFKNNLNNISLVFKDETEDSATQYFHLFFSKEDTTDVLLRPKIVIEYKSKLPQFNSNATIPAVPLFENNATAQINVTHSYNSIIWCNFTVTSPYGIRFSNLNGTNFNTDIWNSSTFLINGTADGQWNISASCSDSYGNVSSKEWHFNINDSSPSISSVAINPSNAKYYENLTGSCSATDYEGNNITYYYKWFKNTALLTGMNTANLTTGNYTTGDNITFQCIASDTYPKNSTAVNSTALTIGDNISPVTSDWYLSSISGFTDEPFIIYTNCSDEGSLIDYVYVEFKNPNGENLGNKTMFIETPPRYFYNYIFNVAGTYTNFIFHCRDKSGNEQTDITNLTFTASTRLGGGSAGGGGGEATICGNTICETGENALNCPVDCSINFTINPSDLSLILARGEEYTRDFTLSNPTTEPITVKIYFSAYETDQSYLWNYILYKNSTSRDLTITIPPGSALKPGLTTFFVKTQVPKDAELKDYRFDMYLQKGDRKVLVTYRITVSTTPSFVITGLALSSSIAKFMVTPVVNLPIVNFISIPIVIIIIMLLAYVVIRLGK